MLRGFIKFKCDKCGHKFMAPDIEYMASTLSQPQQCPHCKSFHTYPYRHLLSTPGLYRKIWEDYPE